MSSLNGSAPIRYLTKAGRLYEFELRPLNFRDFLEMKDIALPATMDKFDFKTFEEKKSELLLYEDDIKSILNEY